MIVVNQVLKLEDDRMVRVLWVDDSYAYIFDLGSLRAPEKVDISELYKTSEEIEDPYAVYADEGSLSEKHKEIREKSWKLIADIVEYEPEIYQSTVRGTLIRKIPEQSGTNRKNVYSIIKRYWQRGKSQRRSAA